MTMVTNIRHSESLSTAIATLSLALFAVPQGRVISNVAHDQLKKKCAGAPLVSRVEPGLRDNSTAAPDEPAKKNKKKKQS